MSDPRPGLGRRRSRREFLKWAGGAGLIASSVVIAEILTGPNARNVRGGHVFLLDDYGADPTGVADSQSAFSTVLSMMKPGDRIHLPAGSVYAHSNVINLNVPGITVYGRGTLKATVTTAAAVRVTADGIRVDGIQITHPTNHRGGVTTRSGLCLMNCAGAKVRNVTVDTSAGAGIVAYGASHFRVENCLVQNSGADAFHNTVAAHDGDWVNCTAVNSGDDGFSVVSYDSDPGPVRNIECTGFRLLGSHHGGGMGVAGGQSIVLRSFKVYDSWGAGVHLNIDNSFRTRSISDVRIFDGELVRCNQFASGAPLYGSIFIDNNWTFSAGKSIDNVRIYDVVIRDAGASIGTGTSSKTIWYVHTGLGAVSGVNISQIFIRGARTEKIVSSADSSVAFHDIDLGRMPTVSAPTAVNAGDGVKYYNTTLDKEMFSNGRSWAITPP